MKDKSAAEADEAAPANATGLDAFGDDDLGRLQGILFGDHAQRTNDRIDTLEQALLGAIGDVRDHVDQQMQVLLKKVAAEGENRKKSVSNLASRVDKEVRERKKVVKRVEGQLDSTHERLTETLDLAANEARVELDAARRDLASQIEAAESDLDDRKVDRAVLATLLSATATELNK